MVKQNSTAGYGDPNIYRDAVPAEPGERQKTGLRLTMEEIRLRAYRNWQAAGKPNGDCVRFWLQAEQEMLQSGSGPPREGESS